MLVTVVSDKMPNHQAVFHYFYIALIPENFMKKTISKTKAKNKIEEFIKNLKDKSLKEIKKIKRLAMNYKIPLKEKRKSFCKYCLNPYSGKEKVRIKNKIRTILINV